MKLSNLSLTEPQFGAASTPATPANQPTTHDGLAAANRPRPVHSGPSGSPPVCLAYTVEEAAVALNVCTKTIRRLLDRGILTASKALRKKLIPRSQIEGFLKATCDAPKSIL